MTPILGIFFCDLLLFLFQFNSCLLLTPNIRHIYRITRLIKSLRSLSYRIFKKKKDFMIYNTSNSNHKYITILKRMANCT